MSARRWTWFGIGASCALVTLALCASSASANSDTQVLYSKAQTFSSALRYLRVDMGFTVTEKDPDAAYLMFEYQASERKKPSFGSIEIVQNDDAVKVVVRLPEMPQYQEQVLADGLLRKLKADYGEPVARKADDDRKKKKVKETAKADEAPPAKDSENREAEGSSSDEPGQKQ